MHFISLLTAPTVKNCHMEVKVYYIFLKTVLNKLESGLIPNDDLIEKTVKAVTK